MGSTKSERLQPQCQTWYGSGSIEQIDEVSIHTCTLYSETVGVGFSLGARIQRSRLNMFEGFSKGPDGLMSSSVSLVSVCVSLPPLSPWEGVAA